MRLKDSRKILQDKEEIKEALGRSPNNADAYVLTALILSENFSISARGLALFLLGSLYRFLT